MRMRMFAEGTSAGAVGRTPTSVGGSAASAGEGLEENMRFSQNLQALEFNLAAIESGEPLPDLKRVKSPLLSPSSSTPTRGVTSRKMLSPAATTPTCGVTSRRKHSREGTGRAEAASESAW